MTTPRALEGIRVLDLGRVVAGPFASQLLADFGAEVIKIERPGPGDDGRSMNGVAVVDRAGNRIMSEGAIFVSANRGKKSITLDFNKEEGREILRQLVAVSDVLVENFSVGVMDKFGLGYEALAKVNPRLVYCSVTAYGADGPYARMPGYDPLMQAFGGLMSINGQPDGAPGAGPVKVGSAVTDFVTGLDAAFGIMVALRYRDVTGRGQKIDTSLLDASTLLQADCLQKYLLNGEMPGRWGTEHPGGGPAGVYRAADGDVFLVAGNQQHFAPFCAVIGIPEAGIDPRFATYAARPKHRAELNELVGKTVATWKVRDLVEACNKAGIPATPVNDYEMLFDDPQVKHRELSVPVAHPESDTLRLVANPVRMSETPATYRRMPRLGEHTGSVLGDVLGYDAAKIEALKQGGVI